MRSNISRVKLVILIVLFQTMDVFSMTGVHQQAEQPNNLKVKPYCKFNSKPETADVP